METSASFEARYAPLPYPTNQVPDLPAEAQSSRIVDLWKTGNELLQKSSKIVPLGAPLFLILQSSVRSLLRADPKAGRSLSARSLRIIQRPIDAVLLIC